jgi:DNA-binding NarL/FixJ family response regulator
MPLRVAVVEDNPRYRDTVSELLRHEAEFSVAASFSGPLELLRRAEAAAAANADAGWDLVIMDLEMPEMGGIEATRRLKALLPSIKVMVLTVFEQPATILEAICAGADGYLLKRSRAAELLEGLRTLGSGGAPLTPNVARSVLDIVRRAPSAPVAGPAAEPSRLDLTEREQQVLRALVEGLSYKQVSDVLGISLGTVRSHVVAVYRKLQVHSVAEAVGRAIRERIV